MKNLKPLFFVLLLFATSCKATQVSIIQQSTEEEAVLPLTYELRMSTPETHYFEVRMNINDVLSNSKLLDKEHLLIKMPVWTPGSYLVREYARHVQDFEAKDENGKLLKSRKINKNTWEIELDHAEDVQVDYKVYAYDLTVRTSFLDEAHGYVNGASVFMFVPELMQQTSQLTVIPNQNWSTVSTAMPETAANTFVIKDYDTLVDSPIEIGNHEVLEFEAAGVPHKIAMFSVSPLNYDKEKLLSDYTKMIEAATAIVGETPLDHYLFIIHHQPGIGGGLEHLFSTTCQTSTLAYSSEAAYKGFFALLAHEYFHLWNVKRIRPVALGPFDYENENYTHMLWVAEGFTNYFEEQILLDAGLYTEADVLINQANNISGVENRPGNKVQAVTAASWDAWIKAYRPNENSANTTISYYPKGALLAHMLEITIISETNGEKSLADVMKLLYSKYYKELGRGYTDEELQQAVETVAGVDLEDFFQNYVWDTKSPDYASFFSKIGLDFVDTNANSDTPYLGISERGGQIFVLSTAGSAVNSGLNVGDQILIIDGKSGVTFLDALKGKTTGSDMEVKVRRYGVDHTYTFPLKADPRKSYKLTKKASMSASQAKAYEKFMEL